jgi:predicted nucleotidyltransferase
METVDELRRQPELPNSAEQEAAGRQTSLVPAISTASPLVFKLRERLPAALEDEPVQLAYLYGSSVTGQTTPFSDADIALVVGVAIDPLARLKLILRVQLALADRCDIENADVRVIDDAPLVFRGRVVSDGVLVYSKDERERVAFETTTRMRYFDYLPIHRELQEGFFQDIRERGLYG